MIQLILGSSEIIKLIKEKKLIENVDLRNVGGAGVDIRAGSFYRIKSGACLGIGRRELPEVEPIRLNIVTIEPGEYILVETLEKVNMPENLCARMLPRSTLQRSGVYLFTALIDPGFNGTLTFGLKNLSKFPFKLEKGSRIAQIIFEEVRGNSKRYDGRYQGGKVT